jgi:hypothetical protein
VLDLGYLDLLTVISTAIFSLFSLSLPPQDAVPAFVSPPLAGLGMFRPVMIDSRDSITSQGNGTLNFQSLNVQYLGPKALSVFICSIETGVIILLFARFFARKRERLTIQLLVYFVTFLALYVAFQHLPHYKSIF